MKQVNVFFLVPGRQLGGCTSYTVHLVRAFELLGYTVRLMRVGSRAAMGLPFGYGLAIDCVTLDEAVREAQRHPSLIAYAFWSKKSAEASALIALGARLVIHDPAEFHESALGFLREHGARPLVIREANVRGLAAHGIAAELAPHPYVPIERPRVPVLMHGVSLSRLDFRKHTEVIVEANKLVGAAHAVRLYGEVARVYEFMRLRQLHPDWRSWYGGEFPAVFGQATRMFARARFAVDLTSIRGDGGGTQYTFFEAWNAGVPLILNRAWETGPGDTVRHGRECIMVDGAQELASVLTEPPESFSAVVRGGAERMAAHGPANVVPTYLRAMGA